MNIEKELEVIKRRLDLLENKRGLDSNLSALELELKLPEADIGGLHFNETKVHAVFEKRDDGWWHSRDILFLSARNRADDNSRDILTEYLDSDAFRECIRRGLAEETFGDRFYLSKIAVSLPKKNEGTKKYNGADCWHWLANAYAGSASFFCCYGATAYNGASGVGGVAPMFHVVKKEGEIDEV
jgi:hypothetical protein